jgi:hypothetical protein
VEASEKALVKCSGPTEPSLRACGKRGSLMAKESSSILMEISMMELGKTTSATVMECTQIRKVPSTRVTGRMILRRAKELKLGQRAQSMKASMTTAKSKGSAHTTGQMGAFTKVTGRTTRSMARASTSGKMVDNTMAAGKTMTWMAWAFISTLTVLLMRANTKKTRKLAMASITGPTGESMKAGGTKVNSTALVFIRTRRKIKLSTDSGRWDRGGPGSMSRLSIKLITTSTNMRLNLLIPRAQNALNLKPHLRDQLILTQR